MKTSKPRFTLGLTLACAAITLSLVVGAQAQTVTFPYHFTGTIQLGATSLSQGTDGNFYGTTAAAGDDITGYFFRLTPSGELTPIYYFCSLPNCADGQWPGPAPLLGSDGNFYGAMQEGGSNVVYPAGSGTIYKMTLGGKLTTLYDFCTTAPCNDGVSPTALIQASDGNFYGTAIVGGAFGEGTIFRISSTGAFQLLYTFCSQGGENCTDGARPNFPPIQGIDGNFYGATYEGGSQGGGVIYKLTAAGSYSVLYNFPSGYSGAGEGPNTVVQDANGNFFGTTAFGGSYSAGTIYELTATGQHIILHAFDGTDGVYPTQGLLQGNDGNFYGLTQGGGVGNVGVLFEITPSGDFTKLYNFGPRGYDPFEGPLFEGTNGNIYGTTLYSAGACCYGTIFSLANNLSPLVETAPIAGKIGTRVIILGNNLTGSTRVTFNGVPANFTVESDTFIRATVPAGATTGTVSVVTPTGTLNSNPQFVVAN